jgi:hypothetical protein
MKKEEENENIRFVTLVVPYKNEKQNIKVELIGNSEVGSSNLQLEIDDKGKRKKIGYTL